jgi:hypothetical protein
MPSFPVRLRLLALVSASAVLSAADAPEAKMDPAGLDVFREEHPPDLHRALL